MLEAADHVARIQLNQRNFFPYLLLMLHIVCFIHVHVVVGAVAATLKGIYHERESCAAMSICMYILDKCIEQQIERNNAKLKTEEEEEEENI